MDNSFIKDIQNLVFLSNDFRQIEHIQSEENQEIIFIFRKTKKAKVETPPIQSRASYLLLTKELELREKGLYNLDSLRFSKRKQWYKEEFLKEKLLQRLVNKKEIDCFLCEKKLSIKETCVTKYHRYPAERYDIKNYKVSCKRCQNIWANIDPRYISEGRLNKIKQVMKTSLSNKIFSLHEIYNLDPSCLAKEKFLDASVED